MKLSLSKSELSMWFLNDFGHLIQCRSHSVIAYTSVPLREQESIQIKKRL